VCNVGVATEGYDDPGIHSVIMARKTKSFGLYLQMAGRGLRPDPKTDKHELILLDHADNLGEHGSPDEPVAWSLDPDRPAAQHTEETKKQSKVGRQWRCSLCFYVNDGGTHCGRCGMQRQRDAKTPEVAKGRLIEVDRKRQVRMGRDDAERIWQECLWKSIHKGLKVGAAAHMYRKETGKWPRGFAGMPRGSEWQMNAADFHRQQRGL
jgi:superfamily II DNA or RNA helicase